MWNTEVVELTSIGELEQMATLKCGLQHQNSGSMGRDKESRSVKLTGCASTDSNARQYLSEILNNLALADCIASLVQ